ncbi:hypothetical protein [Aeromicrobium choanae]|uniref:Gram-positive cocci surface proteins LPxTG domain-containing protein n=1 Tax=Aeromicrobium choanae TaxID=1736691 RepID=A0A1T4YZM3_9ACTN|nr:hypothetical protein [Aeromicrobium choanae]SKB06761.1 hypothetical protein SAMN06295964_1436 [Aeromicrobium choanae]
MPTRQRLFVPFVLALVIGASAPAVADDTAAQSDPVIETATVPTEPVAEPSAKPSPEPSEVPTPEAEPTPEPTQPTQPTQPTATPPTDDEATPQARRLAVAAAPSTVLTAAEFTAALSACATDDVVTLGADVTVSARSAIGCDLTIDLAGHTLVAPGIDIAWDRHLTVDDSGTGGRLVAATTTGQRAGIRTTRARLTIEGGHVQASGGIYAAAIGGGESDPSDPSSLGPNGVVTINGGTVTATGGYFAAGIGGAGWGSGGTVVVNGGTVNATGGEMGAGIGGGYGRYMTSIAINGGTVSATTTGNAPALGNGGDVTGTSGTITIGAGADVTLRAATGTPVIRGASPRATVDGTVHVQSGVLGGLVTIGSTGSISGPAAAPRDGVAVAADARVVNDGVLIASSVDPAASITGHHYRLTLDSAGGPAFDPLTVLAPALADGLASLPVPSRAGLSFLGWERGGAAFDASTDLGAGSTDGRPVEVGLRARWGIRTTADLSTALSTCPDSTVAMAADLTVSSPVTVSCDVTLDLAGHDLTVSGITVADGRTFTIDDSAGDGMLTSTSATSAGIRTTGAALVIDGGTVRATGGPSAAGIGGGPNDSSGTVTINDGTVEATGSSTGSAGIGGGFGGSGGTITINGGVVDARSPHDGAAIGGGTRASAGTITITGGDITARAVGYAGTGMGGGWQSTGGTVHITGGVVHSTGAARGTGIGSGLQSTAPTVVVVSGGTVVATGGQSAPGIGTGSLSSARADIEIGADAHVTVVGGSAAETVLGNADATAGTHGSIRIDGLVRAPSGTFLTSRNDLTIGATGRLVGTAAEPTTGASITGTGTVANGGVIALTGVAGTVGVTGHHYEVAAPTGTVKVYGPTVQAGHRTMPSDPTRGVDAFTGWTLDGDPFTAATTLPGTSSDGDPVRVDLTAAWVDGAAAFDTSAVTLTAGNSAVLDLTLTDGDGALVQVAASDWNITLPAGVSLVHSTGTRWTVTGTTIGTGAVTASTVVGGRTYTAEFDVTVNAAAVASVVVSHTGTAAQGETITLTVTGADAFRNDLGDVTGDVTFTSSNASDVIDGNEISFTRAGPRTVTATHANGTTALQLVTVAVVHDVVTEMTLDSTGTAAQGETLTLSAEGTDRFDNDLGDVTSDVTFTSSNASDVIDGDEISFTQAGERTITATHANGTTATLVVDVAVVLDEVARMVLGFSGAAREGDTVAMTVTGTDRFGNDLGDVTSDVTFTSSVATDVIDGHRITFPHASPHTITATHANGSVSTLLIEVEALPVVDEPQVDTDGPAGDDASENDGEQTAAKPSPKEADLADTGGTIAAWWLACALALLLAGGGLVWRVRRR